MIYAMHAINLWHTIHHWCNRGSMRTLECSHSLQLVATWCKMVEMSGMMMAMVMIMLAMVAIMLVVLIVAPSFVDSFCHWLVYNCIVKHVHVLHAWYHHYCRVIAIAGLWHHWHRLVQGGSLCAWSQFMYISVKLTCTCLLLLSCLCN